MGIVKNWLDFESAVEFIRGAALNVEVFLDTFPNSGVVGSDVTLADILNTPGVLIPSVLREMEEESDILKPKEFLFCEPRLPLEFVDTTECQDCIKNPAAFVENWTTKDPGYVFLDKKNCVYSTVVDTGVLNIPNDNELQFLISNGVKNILNFLNKTDIFTAIIYQPLFGTAVRDTGLQTEGDSLLLDLRDGTAISSLESKNLQDLYNSVAKRKAEFLAGNATSPDVFLRMPNKRFGFQRIAEEFYSLDEIGPLAVEYFFKNKNDYIYDTITPNITTKILVSIPVEYLSAIPEKVVTQPDIVYDTDLEVTINGDDYSTIFKNVSRNILRASRFIKNIKLDSDNETLEKTQFYLRDAPEDSLPLVIDFSNESLNLIRFQKDYLNPAIKSSLGVKINRLEKVIINFQIDPVNSSLSIAEVSANKYGCPIVQLSQFKGRYQEVDKLFNYNNSIVLGYVAALPDMFYYLQGKEDIVWLEFLTKFTYPGLEIRDTSALLLLSENLDAELGKCIAKSSLNSIVNSLIQSLIQFPSLLGGALKDVMCSTVQELADEHNASVEQRIDLERNIQEARKASRKAKKAENKAEQISNTDIQTDNSVQNAEKELGLAEQALTDYVNQERQKRNNQERANKLQRQINNLSRNNSATDTRISKLQSDLNSLGIQPTIPSLNEKIKIRNKNKQLFNNNLNEKISLWLNSSSTSSRPLLKVITTAIQGSIEGSPSTPDDLLGVYLKSLNSAGGWCTWVSLIKEATQCLANGLGEEDIFKALLRPVLKSLTPFELQKVFKGLPPEVRNRLSASLTQTVPNLINGVFPWDYETTQTQNFNRKQEIEIIKQENANISVEQLQEKIKEQRNNFVSNRLDNNSGSSVREIGINLDVLVDSLIEIMFELLQVQEIVSIIKDVPGVGFLLSVIRELKCVLPPLPLVNPPIDDFLKTLKVDICYLTAKGSLDISLPPILKDLKKYFLSLWLNIRSIFKMLREKAVEILIDIATQILVRLITQLVETLLDMLCKGAAWLTSSLGDLIEGNSNFRNSLKSQLCPDDISDEEFTNALKNIVDSLFRTPDTSSCSQNLTNKELGSYIDNILVTLNYGQLFDLLLCSASDDVLNICSTLAINSGSDNISCIFGNTLNVRDYFCGLGRLINVGELLSDFPANISLTETASVCPPDTLEQLDNLRAKLLANKGLNPQEINDQLNSLKERAAQKLENIADVLRNGAFNELPDLYSTRFGEESCNNDSIIKLDYTKIRLSRLSNESIFQPIQNKLASDLIGQDGIISHILSDTAGNHLHRHNYYTNFFGNQYGQLNRFTSNYSNNYIRKTEISNGNLIATTDTIDQYGNSLEVPAGSLVQQRGGYPPTISSYLMNIYQKFDYGSKTTDTVGNIVNVNEKFTTRRLTENTEQSIANSVSTNDLIISKRKEFVAKWLYSNGIIKIEDAQKYIPAQLGTQELYIDPQSSRGGLSRYSYEDRVFYYEKLIEACSKDIFNEDIEFANDSFERALKSLLFGYPRNGSPNFSFLLFDTYIVASLEESIFNEVSKVGLGLPVALQNLYSYSDSRTNNLFNYEKAFIYTDIYNSILNNRLLDSGIQIDSKFALIEDNNAYEISLNYYTYGKPIKNKNKNVAVSKPDSGFKITYNMNLENDQGNIEATKSGDYRVVLTELFNPFSDPTITGQDNQSYFKDYYQNIKDELDSSGNYDEAYSEFLNPPITSGGSQSYVSFDKIIKSNLKEQVKTKIESYKSDIRPSEVLYSYDSEYLVRFLLESTSKLLSGQNYNNFRANLLSFDSKAKINDLFDFINDGLIKRLSKRIGEGSGDSRLQDNSLNSSVPISPQIALSPQGAIAAAAAANGIGGNMIVPKAFRFGYDPNQLPEVFILDPVQYGFNPNRPPVYIKPPEFSGWLGIVQKLVPEKDACDPARSPIYDMRDIQENASIFERSITKDIRLTYDPLCTKEAPYDSIFDESTLGSLEGVLQATVRSYLIDFILRMAPVFSEFSIDTELNFDELLEIYISDYILDFIKAVDLKRTFFPRVREIKRTGFRNFEVLSESERNLNYYYGILEIAVTNTLKKLQSGMLKEEDLSATQLESINKIKESIFNYYKEYDNTEAVLSEEAISAQSIFGRVFNSTYRNNPGNSSLGLGSTNFNKVRAKRVKNSLNYMVLKETEEEAKVILSLYVKEQFNQLKTKINSAMGPKVERLDYLFLSSPYFVNGNIKFEKDTNGSISTVSGPYDVMSDPTDVTKFNINLNAFSDDNVILNGSGVKWPFVLEKYIKIEDKELVQFTDPEISDPILNRSENLFDIVNINDWYTFIQNLLNSNTQINGKISDYWNSDIENGKTGWKYGLRLSMIFDKDSEYILPLLESLNVINDSDIMKKKSFRLNSTSGEKILIPLVITERDVKDNYLSNVSIDDFDLLCLVRDMADSVEFQTLFNAIFPYKRYMSMLSIYSARSFYESIGNAGSPSNGGDRWEVPGGRVGSTFKKWDKQLPIFGGPFETGTAEVLMTNFLALYRQKNQLVRNKNKNVKDPPKSLQELFKLLIPNLDTLISDLPFWARKGLIERPFDMFDNECSDFDSDFEEGDF